MERCVFCGGTGGRATDEHVIPKWARRAFDMQGPVTYYASEQADAVQRRVGRMQHLNVVLRDAVCEDCNTGWMSRLELAAMRVLRPMAVSAKPTALGPGVLPVLATWAVKTVWLLELALRQQYPGARLIQGYRASEVEFAWLGAKREPPPRAMVWLGCWDCQQETPVMYEPSTALLPTPDGGSVTGHLATFALGFVAFQVFTVDFLEAEQHGAPVWNTHVPPSLAGALPRIWPHLGGGEVSWPPAAFRKEDWRCLVTWDGMLRQEDATD